MKIRCGSHQQNRSIVRPGLSLMATKVALTAEEFRENSQRSIALFNTEKLSTDSTHVLKSAYCILRISAVAICTERVEAKNVFARKICFSSLLQSARSVWRQSPRRRGSGHQRRVAICTERVEAKVPRHILRRVLRALQSARSVWRQRRWHFAAFRGTMVAICTERVEAKNHSNLDYTVKRVAICTRRVEDLASSSEKNPRKFMQTYCIFIHLGV